MTGNALLRPAAYSVAAAPTVESYVPAGIPVEFVGLAYTAEPGKIGNLRFALKNTGNLPVVAYEVWIDVYAGNKRLRTPAYADWWLTENALSPSYSSKPTHPLSFASASGITRVVLTVAYVEFAGGQRIGEDAANFHEALAQQRALSKQVFGQALEMARTGESELREWLEVREARARKEMDLRPELARLRSQFAGGGTAAVIRDAIRVLSLLE